MANSNHNKNGRRILALLRRSQQWLEISGYHVGDIQSIDTPVAIKPGSTVVGDIFAPEISISGLVCGSIVAKTVTIIDGGQVWGDAFAIRLNLESGGKIQGWTSSVDEETYLSLLHDHRFPDGVDMPPPPEESLDTNRQNNRSEFELAAYHLLQSEIATTKAARAELEHSFEKRLSEVAGNASTNISTLEEQVEEKQSNIIRLEAKIQQIQQQIRQRDSQIERHQNEFSVSQTLISEQTNELTTLRQTKEHLTTQFREQTEAKENLELLLKTKIQELETQSDRIHSIETAMQSSLQHSSDLEASLVRWQELAEVTEKRVAVLEKELDKAHFDLQENQKLVEMLRDQKHQAEEEWQRAHSQLDSMRQYPTRPLDNRELSGNDSLLAEASAQVAFLESELADIAQEHTEQILWYRASLEMAQTELSLIRETLSSEQETLKEMAKQISSLEASLELAQAELVTQKEEMAEITAVLQAAENGVAAKDALLSAAEAELITYKTRLEAVESELASQKEMMSEWQTAVAQSTQTLAAKQQQFDDLQESTTAELTSLKTELKKKGLQLEASEEDLAFHLKALERQSVDFAEVRSILVERELQLQKSRDMMKRQHQMMKEMRQKAETHIRNLQNKINSASSIQK